MKAEIKILHSTPKVAQNGNKYLLVHALVTINTGTQTYEEVRNFAIFENGKGDRSKQE